MAKILGRIAVKSYTTFSMESNYYSPILLRINKEEYNMARFHIDDKLRKNLEYFGQEKAKKLAQEARERLTNHYISLIDWYYLDYVPKLNKYENHAFIADQVDRFGTLIGVTLKPVLDKLATELENMDDEKITKLSKALENGLKRIK